MRGMIALAVSFGLIIAAAASGSAAVLPTDQVLVKKQAQETSAQVLRDAMKWRRSNIQPQSP
ncbi:hypothetical protein [Candidatus Electronema sp. TJ]|uniref:hypothetical protein n=1 Tax=Candidatus Electronema sp. TJ TaxID=3401573 RepID=UPI003AA870D1